MYIKEQRYSDKSANKDGLPVALKRPKYFQALGIQKTWCWWDGQTVDRTGPEGGTIVWERSGRCCPGSDEEERCAIHIALRDTSPHTSGS